MLEVHLPALALAAAVTAAAFALGAAFIAVGVRRGRLDPALWGTWWLQLAVVGWIALPALAGPGPWRAIVLATGLVAGWELWRGVGLRPWAALFPGAGLAALWALEPLHALFLFGVVEITDTGAFLVGRLGKRPLAPRLSPRKTVEGAVAGALCGTLAGLVAAPTLGLPPLAAPALALGAVAADLSQSALKRRLGIVDFGTWLPRHGALLDVYDGLLLLAAPWALWIAALG